MRYLLLLFIFSSCSQVVFTPSAHVGIYSLQRLNRGSELHFSAKFGEDFPYEYGNSNQGDWNKLCGLAMFENPHQESSLIGFRWDSIDSKIEIVPYYHFSNRTSFDDNTIPLGSGTARSSNQIVKYDIGEEINGKIELDKNGYWVVSVYRSDSLVLYESYNTEIIHKKCRGVQPWWGGQEKPPTKKIVSLELKYF